MSLNRGQYSFYPINSTATSFNATASDSAGLFALESTGVRDWSGASGRAVRVAAIASDDYYISLGTSNVVVASTANMLILGGTVEAFHAPAGVTHISLMGSSTDVTVNVTLGYGQ